MPGPLNLLAIGYWPLWVGCGLLAVAAVVNHVQGRVPNALSLGALGAGWFAALVVTGPGAVPAFGGGIASSLVCSAVALVMLLGLYRLGLGAGCIKMQMAFAGWVGCGLSLQPAVLVTLVATLLGTLLTLAGWFLYVRHGRRERETAAAFGQNDRPSAWQWFPAQWTLSLGSIAGLVLLFVPR